jgi:hypothetical protein
MRHVNLAPFQTQDEGRAVVPRFFNRLSRRLRLPTGPHILIEGHTRATAYMRHDRLDLLALTPRLVPMEVPPAGIEPATPGLGNRCSTPLSYEG